MEPKTNDDPSILGIFFDGLPTMAGIVTVTAQPFAQASLQEVLSVPIWLPYVIAAAVSGLLAVYKVMIVRESGRRECLVCVPLVMLMIFSGYLTGNNLVYYAKEGYTRPSAPTTGPEVAALTQERDILEQQFKSAQDVIDTLRGRAPSPGPGGTPRSSLPAPLALPRWLTVGEAQAQPPPSPAAPDLRPVERGLDMRKVNEKLSQYDIKQRELGKKLEELKRQEKRSAPEQKSLIKSW